MMRLQKVLWSKGVLLSPQHLQAQDGYLAELMTFQLGALSVAPWGFSRLEIDPEALAGGAFRLTGAAGLFPDGLPFDVPGSDVQPAPKALEGHWRPDQAAMGVYLAVPDSRGGGQNVSLNGEVGHTRFRAEAVMRRDENTGQTEVPLQLARRNLRLMVDGESLEGHAVLQVARLLKPAGGEVHLDPHFVPPLVDVSASSRLMALGRRMVEVLSARSSALAGTRRQRNRSLADFGASDLASFWLLYTVNTHLPVVRHLFEVRRGHPEAAYRALLELAGALTTFSPTVHPRDLPPYSHADLGGCFGALDALLGQLLDAAIPTNHLTVPLREVEPLVYAAALDDDRLLAAPQIYLALRAPMPADELGRRAPQLLKVSAGDQIDRLIRLALPGVPLRHTPTPPVELPVKLDYQYFLLDRAGPEWSAVRGARNLAVYVPPADFPEAQLELLVLLPPRQE